MSEWLYEVNIKQYLTEDLTWKGMTKAANEIAKELRENLPAVFFSDLYNLQDAVSFLEGVDELDWDIYSSEQELLHEVNEALSDIYSFADENKVWLGIVDCRRG